MSKKKDKAPVEKPEVVDEDKLPVMSMEDCESFDPSADKVANTSAEEDDWEDEDSEEDFSD